MTTAAEQTCPQCPKCERGGSGPHPAFCTPEMRFWRKIRKVGGCWEWQGSRHPRGYGQFRVGNGTKRGLLIFAHRFAYEGSFGPATDGMEVMHSCDNPSCCRPAHLTLGTHAENMADASRKGRMSRHKSNAMHCKHGHRYTATNTGITKDGHRRCRECENAPRRIEGGRGPRRRHAA